MPTKTEFLNRLVEFMTDTFDKKGIYQFLTMLGSKEYSDVANDINQDMGLNPYCVELVQKLDQRRLVDGEFFEGLRRKRPKREVEVQVLQELWADAYQGRSSIEPDVLDSRAWAVVREAMKNLGLSRETTPGMPSQTTGQGGETPGQAPIRQPAPSLADPRRPGWNGPPPAPEVYVNLAMIDSPEVALGEQRSWAMELGCELESTGVLGLRFRLIPPGRFLMGAHPCDRDSLSNERPQRSVRIEKPFWAAVEPITNRVVRSFLQEVRLVDVPETRKLIEDQEFAATHLRESDELPAVRLKYEDVDVLCAWLSRIDGRRFRLPTEAEWEYLARAGTTGAYWWSEGNDPAERVVFDSLGPAPLDPHRANAWGLVDTLGNVAEWTSSAFEDRLSEEAERPAPSLKTHTRVIRGGSWRDTLKYVRLSFRGSMNSGGRKQYLGARLVCEISP